MTDDIDKANTGQNPQAADPRASLPNWPSRRSYLDDRPYAPEKPQTRRSHRDPSIAARATAAYREGHKPGINAGTAARHMQTYRTLIETGLSKKPGRMTLDDQDQQVQVTKFNDMSIMATPENGAPKVLTRINDKRRAMEILAGLENTTAESNGRTA